MHVVTLFLTKETTCIQSLVFSLFNIPYHDNSNLDKYPLFLGHYSTNHVLQPFWFDVSEFDSLEIIMTYFSEQDFYYKLTNEFVNTPDDLSNDTSSFNKYLFTGTKNIPIDTTNYKYLIVVPRGDVLKNPICQIRTPKGNCITITLAYGQTSKYIFEYL